MSETQTTEPIVTPAPEPDKLLEAPDPADIFGTSALDDERADFEAEQLAASKPADGAVPDQGADGATAPVVPAATTPQEPTDTQAAMQADPEHETWKKRHADTAAALAAEKARSAELEQFIRSSPATAAPAPVGSPAPVAGVDQERLISDIRSLGARLGLDDAGLAELAGVQAQMAQAAAAPMAERVQQLEAMLQRNEALQSADRGASAEHEVAQVREGWRAAHPTLTPEVEQTMGAVLIETDLASMSDGSFALNPGVGFSADLLDVAYEAATNPALREAFRGNPGWIDTPEGRDQARWWASIKASTSPPASPSVSPSVLDPAAIDARLRGASTESASNGAPMAAGAPDDPIAAMAAYARGRTSNPFTGS